MFRYLYGLSESHIYLFLRWISFLWPLTPEHRGDKTSYYRVRITHDPLKNSPIMSSGSATRVYQRAVCTQSYHTAMQGCCTLLCWIVGIVSNWLIHLAMSCGMVFQLWAAQKVLFPGTMIGPTIVLWRDATQVQWWCSVNRRELTVISLIWRLATEHRRETTKTFNCVTSLSNAQLKNSHTSYSG